MTPHPLDPLGADEIRAAAAVLRREKGVDDRWRFASIELREVAVDAVSFWLKPVGFFDRNPALDVPRSSTTPASST